MHIDPAAFTRPTPRILIGPGERALVFCALYWGMPERRGDQPYDPVQILWGPTRGRGPVDTEVYGFGDCELVQTHSALEAVVDDPDFSEAASEECRDAMEIVAYAIRQNLAKVPKKEE